MVNIVRASAGSRAWMGYYIAALIISAANFLPLFVDTPLLYEELPTRTVYYLIICYFLSLPLAFEFLLDLFVSNLSSVAEKLKEPKVGYFFLLISLFLPVFTVSGNLENASSPHGVLFINCFVSFLQTLVIIGQYDKLQFRTKGHWTIVGCLSVIFMFVASQVCLNLGVAYSPSHLHLENSVTWSLSVSFICGVICFLLHCRLSKKYLLDWALSHIYGTGSKAAWEIDDYVSIVLQCISSTYFIVNFVVCAIFLVIRYDSQYYLNVNVVTHIILGLCAAILPGRVVRKSFMLLNEKMAIKETFIRYISHEIRSPLSTTSLGLNYLLDKLNAKTIKLSEVRDVVQESIVTCELAMNTLNDFLMLDKIQSNMLEISTCERQASDFMVEAIRPFSLQASSANVNLICNVESVDGLTYRDVTVDMDSYKMNQVLRNLLSNAFKFTPSGGTVTATMSLHVYTSEEMHASKQDVMLQCVDGRHCMVRYAVQDTGHGISAENLPLLFGQYVQFDANKLQGGKGSGLGLWLSKAIVEMHGGRIGATSEGEGKGCTFWFELPCFLSAADRATIHSAGSSFVSRTFSISSPAKNKTPKSNSTSGARSSRSRSIDYEAVEASSLDIESGGDLFGPNPSAAAVQAAIAEVNVSLYDQAMSKSTDSETAPAIGTFSHIRRFVDLQIDVSGSAKTAKLKLYSPHHAKRSPSVGGAAGARQATTSEVKTDAAAPPLTPPRPLKILLVDDSAIARKMVERSLTSIDADCAHARTGVEAVEKVMQARESGVMYDAILMDHYMPEMTGPEAVEVIRSKGYKGIIIGVSGNASTDTEFDVLQAAGKINKVMVKPFNLDMFVDYMAGNMRQEGNEVIM